MTCNTSVFAVLQVWKQKGEEYRVTGGQGWRWLSSTRKHQLVPQDTVGLRSVARKLQARKRKAADPTPKAAADATQTASADATQMASADATQMASADATQKALADATQKASADATQKAATSPDMEDSRTEENMDTEVESEKAESNEKTTNSTTDCSNLDSTKDKDTAKCEESEDRSVVTGVSTVDTNVDKTESSETRPETGADPNRSDSVVTDNNQPQCSSVRDDKMEVDIESVSPVKKTDSTKVVVSQPPQADNSKKKQDLSNHTLPPKLDIPLVDVCKAMSERTYYPKITKPYAKLDLLLQRRLKQEEIENKQRQALQQQINWKLKSQNSPEKDIKETSKEDSAEEKYTESKEKTPEPCDDLDEASPCCYSYWCREKGKEFCYSPTCRKAVLEESELMDMDVAEEVIEAEKDKSIVEVSMEDEEVDVEGDKEEKAEEKKEDETTTTKVDEEDVGEGTNKNTNSNSVVAKVPSSNSQPQTSTAVTVSKPPSLTSPGTTSALSTALNAIKSPTNRAAAVAQLLANQPGLKAYTQAQIMLKKAIEKMSVTELKSKMPPARSSNEPIKLVKYAKFGQKPTAKKKASLPPCHKYLTPSGRKSALALEKYDLKKMARKKGHSETKQFNYNCKMNNVNWIYPCPRPLFRTAWRYRTQTVKSFGGVGLQMRILWACLRWDDLAIKPPAGGTNTVSTESEITTKELLKRRDVGRDGLRSEFLVRKIVVPLGLPSQPKGKLGL